MICWRNLKVNLFKRIIWSYFIFWDKGKVSIKREIDCGLWVVEVNIIFIVRIEFIVVIRSVLFLFNIFVSEI